jgi:hypothetical protein
MIWIVVAQSALEISTVGSRVTLPKNNTGSIYASAYEEDRA